MWIDVDDAACLVWDSLRDAFVGSIPLGGGGGGSQLGSLKALMTSAVAGALNPQQQQTAIQVS